MVLIILTQITAKSFCIKRQALHKKKVVLNNHTIAYITLGKIDKSDEFESLSFFCRI